MHIPGLCFVVAKELKLKRQNMDVQSLGFSVVDDALSYYSSLK